MSTRAVAADGAADALESALETLGPFGLYQRYVVTLLCIPNLLAPMYALSYVFTADQVPFRCVVPECEGFQPEYGNGSAAALALLPADAHCHRFVPLQTLKHSCEREHYHATQTQPCSHFVYENNNTIFAEFSLGCREWQRALVGSVRNAALPLALLLTGYIADTFGRRTAFSVLSGFAGALGVLKAFSVNYRMYLAMEFFEAALGYGFNTAGYLMMVELARPSLRAAFACATGVAYGLGGVLFALAAHRLRYWRHLLLLVHGCALLLPLYCLLLDESVRWLHARGQHRRADSVIRKAARWNKVQLDEEVMHRLGGKPTGATGASRGAWARLVRSRALAGRLAACGWCWAAAAFVYYGLTINSVSLSGDKYVNFALNMAMEVAASLLLVMALERLGRRWSVSTAFALSGLACLVPYVFGAERSGLWLFFAGKLGITFAFNSMYVLTAELFPTELRGSALSACSLIGRIGSVAAPQTPLLSARVQAALYAASSATAALAVLLVPETRRTPLPALVRDAERMSSHTRRAAPAPTPAPAPAPCTPPTRDPHERPRYT